MIGVTMDQLRQRQDMPLILKERLSESRIKAWYDHWLGQVYVSFSGGKDSTVLLDLVRREYPDVPAVFVDTGLEYPEIREFVKTIENVVWLKPKMPFPKVIEKHGYPVVSKEQAKYIREVQNGTTEYMQNKRGGMVIGKDGNSSGAVSKKWRYLMDQTGIKISEKCCDVMKKRPFAIYQKESKRFPYIGTMTEDSTLRKQKYMREGCNAFESKKPTSTPMAFWSESDVWDYIKKNDIPYSKIYDMGYERTGCMFCMFGVHLEKGENRFQRMAKTHPKQYDYCINKLGCGKVMDLIGVDYKPADKQLSLGFCSQTED